MNKHYIRLGLVALALVVVVMVLTALLKPSAPTDTAPVPDADGTRGMPPDTSIVDTSDGKLKAETFTGILESVDTGCFADGECSVEVDGKHVTALMGWSRDTVGSVRGVEGFGDLEQFIGQEVEVYAQETGEGVYTLYGSEGFYIQVKEGATPNPLPTTPPDAVDPTAEWGCATAGCSSQLCVDASEADVVSTCEWREEYACYRNATCERQADGRCGWTVTPELVSCIEQANVGTMDVR